MKIIADGLKPMNETAPEKSLISAYAAEIPAISLLLGS
jgi:hypothetical protein